MIGGSDGDDRFVVDGSEDGIDRITDFGASDTLVLSELLGDAGLPGAPTGADLDASLQFGFDGADTDLAVDVDGAADFAGPDVRLVAEGSIWSARHRRRRPRSIVFSPAASWRSSDPGGDHLGAEHGFDS